MLRVDAIDKLVREAHAVIFASVGGEAEIIEEATTVVSPIVNDAVNVRTTSMTESDSLEAA